MMSSAGWDGNDTNMTSASEEDFQQFLNMNGMGTMSDGMQFDFHGFTSGTPQSIMPQHRQTPSAIMNLPGASNVLSRNNGLLQNSAAIMSSSVGHASLPAHMLSPSIPSDNISNIDAQIQYLQQQKFQQQQRQLQEQQATFFVNHSHSVPPTPQSLQMTPGSGQFYSHIEQMSHRTSFDRGYHQRIAEQQDMAFTPLVSPAVTPLDPHFNMENAFTMPGAYFSPLTSPALHAQTESLSGYDNSTHSNNSPIEMDLEPPAIPVTTTALDAPKKARKPNVPKTRSKPGIKSSPISKPLRRKTGPSPAMMSQVLSEVEEGNLHMVESGLLPLPASTDGSEENASVSPENLSDMPPPPVPSRRSMSKSPYIQAQGAKVQNAVTPRETDDQPPPHPATPASLMKLPASKSKKLNNINSQEPAVTDNIESLELPEALSSAPLAPSTQSRLTPKLLPQLSRPGSSSAKGVTFFPPPSPVTKMPGTVSASQSPLLLPGSSGSSARRTPQLPAKNGRKRSTGSVQVSPALLPRISPNIKPLLPNGAGMSAEDTASRLLMSKSNYQNILEGNMVPGISYPSELSTNLTSKRTSHKLAEQGRRNRINSALQVMAGLLPESQNAMSGDESDKRDGKQSNTSNSKASVVENAIVHMQDLQKENGDLKEQLHALKDQLEKLKGLHPQTKSDSDQPVTASPKGSSAESS